MSTMQEFESSSTLFGGNAPFIEEQYEAYLADPAAVGADWRAYFDTLRDGAADVAHAPVVESFIQLAKHRKLAGAMVDAAAMHKQVLVLRLISKFRTLGLFQADIDPLKRAERPYIADLDIKSYGFTRGRPRHRVTTSARSRGLPEARDRMRLRDLISALQETYCRSFGAEYMYMADTPQKRFIQERLEPVRSRPNYPAEFRKHILERLTAAETLERYLHTKYVGQKRFSGEGGDVDDPDARSSDPESRRRRRAGDGHRDGASRAAQRAGQYAGQDAEGPVRRVRRQARQRSSAGDVEYHQGFSSDVVTPGGLMHLTLAFNPSHLEIVDPVVEGSVRARQHRRRTRRATRCCRC